MKNLIQITLTILGLFVFGSVTMLAQDGRIKGKIIDKESNENVPFATVVIQSDAKTDGTSTDDKGKFDFEKLSPGTYTIVVSYIGFEDTVIENIEIKKDNDFVNLGKIFLQVNTEALSEVEVTGVNKTQVSKIDRKTYAAKDFETAQGGNAADVLGKLPSVTVQPDGNVSVRGTSDFMVYLNGKPTNIDATTLLNQISSNDIDKIDIITVPTARYDAQGKGGIINIKTKSSGIQGFAATATGTIGGAPWANDTDKYSGHSMRDDRFVGGINLMYNTEKYSLHGSFNYNEKNVNGMRIGRARVLVDDQTDPYTYFHMNAQGERPEWYKYYSANVGVDFHLSATKELSFSYFYGNRNNGRAAYYIYNTFDADASGNTIGGVARDEEYIYNPNIDNRYGNYNTASVDYTVDFEEGSNLKLSGTYESSGLSRELSNTNYFYDTKEAIDADIENEYANAKNQSAYGMSDDTPLQGYRGSVDYEKVLESGRTLGVGAQVQYVGIKGDFYFQNDLVTDDLNNSIDFDRTVTAAYIDYAGSGDKISYNFGLRTEYGQQNTFISNTSYLGDFGLSEENNYEQNKLDFFPSAHISYQKSDHTKYILAASRRINRPSLTKMAPFLYRRHFEVYVIGDPTLESEYLNNVELSYETNIGKQNINLTGFYRGTENAVFRVNTTTTQIENPDMHAILQEDVLIRSYTNAGNSTAIGGELTANLFVNSWAKLLVGGSLYNFKIKGDVFGYAVDQESTNYSLKGNMNVDITKELSSTLDYNYTSATVTSQGSNDYFQAMNIAFNYAPEKWEGWNFSLRGLDLLSSNLQGLDTNAFNNQNQQIFYQETEYHRNGPIVELGVTYTFNKVKSKKAKKASAEEHFK
ncbi:TonB-dependent receptor [Flavicella marina]|uniref:TonB-dependent receptor n=1 Tax=Flavicella marina TaxID=1475951 RepID=UPI00186B2445|nr:TonB-dependent receptor [Flavicella marina]